MPAPTALESFARFALGDVVGEPVQAARGAQGFIWKVTTSTGTYAVKQLQPWVEVEPVPFDVRVQLAARDAGIPLPSPVLAPSGDAVIDRVRVYEWVDVGPQLPAPVPLERASEAGELLGRIHRLGVPPIGETGEWYFVSPTEEDWQRVIDDASERGVTSGWIDAVEADIGFLVETGERFAFPRAGPAITCHADFCPMNVLPSIADGRLVVLDWENAGPLAADAELAAALLDWNTTPDGDVDLDGVDALLAAYGGDAAITERSFAMWAVTALNFLRVLVENLVYDFDGNDPVFAEALLPLLAPDSLRARLRAVEALLITLER